MQEYLDYHWWTMAFSDMEKADAAMERLSLPGDSQVEMGVFEYQVPSEPAEMYVTAMGQDLEPEIVKVIEETLPELVEIPHGHMRTLLMAHLDPRTPRGTTYFPGGKPIG